MPCCRIAFLLAVFTFSFAAHAGTLVQFRTVFGDIEVELYDQDKPVTVQNFLNYVKTGRYQNEFAHRLVPNFVIQGGGFTLTTNTIGAVPTFAPITNEINTGKFYSNVFGTIAMAKTSDPNSATSQFFFNLTNNSVSLDDTNNSGGFTVFGHVIAGTNVLNLFNGFQYFTGTQSSNLIVNEGAPFDSLPLLYPSLASTNFIYVDISLLQVAITNQNNTEQISWNSVTGLTNIVEFTTNFPPVWNTLAITNGTGARMTMTDSVVMPSRFYRVRVIY
ncbi:MAG TPA: peptidylprolyl isomerase [Verrucomicrobiae bacterium]|nr:peptidylprolyl isomerase [Verrucomicrobiae bacterium]